MIYTHFTSHPSAAAAAGFSHLGHQSQHSLHTECYWFKKSRQHQPNVGKQVMPAYHWTESPYTEADIVWVLRLLWWFWLRQMAGGFFTISKVHDINLMMRWAALMAMVGGVLDAGPQVATDGHRSGIWMRTAQTACRMASNAGSHLRKPHWLSPEF